MPATPLARDMNLYIYFLCDNILKIHTPDEFPGKMPGKLPGPRPGIPRGFPRLLTNNMSCLITTISISAIIPPKFIPSIKKPIKNPMKTRLFPMLLTNNMDCLIPTISIFALITPQIHIPD